MLGAGVEVKGRLKAPPDLWSESLRTRAAVPGLRTGNVRGGAVLWHKDELPMEKEWWFHILYCAKAKRNKPSSLGKQLVSTCSVLSRTCSVTSLANTVGK